MSFTTPPTPALRTLAPRVFYASSLGILGQYVLTAVGAAILAAAYQVVQDETKNLMSALRQRQQFDAIRNENLLFHVLGSDLPAELQEDLLRSRHGFKTALRLLVDPAVSARDKALLRTLLRRAYADQQHRAPGWDRDAGWERPEDQDDD